MHIIFLMKNFYSTLNFSFLIVGSMVGAGFASGKEILTFFEKFSLLSFFSLIVICLLLYYLLKVFCVIGRKLKIETLEDINEVVFKKWSKLISVFIIVSLMIINSSMIAGSDSIGKQFFSSYDFEFIGLITIVLAMIVTYSGFKNLKKINFYLIIFLLIVINILSGIAIFTPRSVVTAPETISVFTAAKPLVFPFLWLALNMFTTSYLASIDAQRVSKKVSDSGSFFAALFVSLSIGNVLVALTKHYDCVKFSDIPMLKLAEIVGGIAPALYAFILWASIFTTLISSMYGVVTFTNKYVKNKFFSIAIVGGVAYAFSRFGFSFIVDVIYPIQGVIGVVYILGCYNYYKKYLKEKTPHYEKSF